MENVVYVLGAGFSAPLGLPLVSNFLAKAKDLYYSGNENYHHFAEVLKTIERLSIAKNYYHADLSNIEEILSIVEMEQTLGGKRDRDAVTQFIKDVISACTPEMTEPQFPGNWQDFVFGRRPDWKPYGAFVGGIMNLCFREGSVSDYGESRRTFFVSQHKEPSFSYGIVTLNYDLVIENTIGFIEKHYKYSNAKHKEISFSDTFNKIEVAKLHGTVAGVLVPPTWNKAFDTKIIPEWEKAFSMLKNANHIRFLGYSLPAADAYVKYLLKAAILETKNLKTIDVLCLDRDGAVKERYDAFIDFRGYQFRSSNINSALHAVSNRALSDLNHGDRNILSFNIALESEHSSIFQYA